MVPDPKKDKDRAAPLAYESRVDPAPPPVPPPPQRPGWTERTLEPNYVVVGLVLVLLALIVLGCLIGSCALSLVGREAQ